MADVAELKQQFASVPEFEKSPLYTALARVVFDNDRLLRLAARCRPGQYPTFLFFGAVHYLLLGDADHELASFYPSIVGDDAPPAGRCRPCTPLLLRHIRGGAHDPAR